jgi:hypothetical protein
MSLWDQSDDDILRTITDGYASGFYTRAEAVGGMIELLSTTPDFRTVWPRAPDWVRSEIRAFLDGCEETTVLYSYIHQRTSVISSSLIQLKNWLAQQDGTN